MSGFGGFWDKAQALAQQVADNARTQAQKAQEKASQIDTSKMQKVVKQAQAQASEAINQARIAAEPQLAQAREQAKSLSKVNGKWLLNSNAQFGVPLEVLTERDDQSAPLPEPRIPVVLIKVIHYLEKYEEDEYVVSGKPLFSQPGVQSSIKALIKNLDERVAGVDLAATADAHTVAALLRQWLIDLPDPLLTHESYDAFIAASLLEDPVAAMREIARKLPLSQRKTVKYLFGFLTKVGTKGKLDIATLALCFGPALLRPKRREGVLRGLMEDLPAIVTATELMISSGDTVFAVEV